jgi:hypothetical protein
MWGGPIDDILQVVTLTGNWNWDSTSGPNPKLARLLVVWKKYPKARDCWPQACGFGSLYAVRPTLTAHKLNLYGPHLIIYAFTFALTLRCCSLSLQQPLVPPHPQVTFPDGTVSKNHWVRRLVVCVYGMSCLLIPTG